MSIFGRLDAANIPTNPFFVEAGEYSAEVTAASYKKTDDGGRTLVIEYTINDEDSAYLDNKVSQRFVLMDPDMTEEAFALLPGEEKKRIQRSNASLKRTLCGSNEKQRGLGVPVDDLNDADWNPATLIGTKVQIAVVNNGANNEWSNVKWVNLQDE